MLSPFCVSHNASCPCVCVLCVCVRVCGVIRFSTASGSFEKRWEKDLPNLLSVAANEKYVVVSTHKGEVSVLQADSGRFVRTIDSHTEWVDACRVFGDNVYSCTLYWWSQCKGAAVLCCAVQCCAVCVCVCVCVCLCCVCAYVSVCLCVCSAFEAATLRGSEHLS